MEPAVKEANLISRTSPEVKSLRLLILGGGAVVTEFYLPALDRLGWKNGITVVERNKETLETLRKFFSWVETREGNYQDMLSNSEVVSNHDAAVVALPNTLHVAAVTASLRAGLPVLCDKPLALSSTDCLTLAKEASTRGLPLAVGMVRRLTPAARAARAAIDSNLIGKVVEVVLDHGGPYGWVSESGAFFKRENGGILTDLGVHHLDWLEELLGPLDPVAYEDDVRGGVEASCRYELRSQDGINVLMSLSYRRQGANTTVIKGEFGELVIDRNNFGSCQWHNYSNSIQGELSQDNLFRDQSWPKDFVSCFAQQFYDFAENVWNGSEPAATASRAARTMQLIEHAYHVRSQSSSPGDSARPRLEVGKAVITGGSGFIGTALVERLTDCGFEDLVVPVRRYRTAASVARFPVELPRVDLNDRAAVRETLKGARWVFHLAYGQTPADAEKITVDATRIVVEEAVAAGVEAVIVLSTMYVFGNPVTDKLVDESWDYSPIGGDYGKTKTKMEKWCFGNIDKMGSTRLVILNPSCVFGPEGKTYTRLPGELAGRGEFAWVEGGQGTANYVYIDNLIDAMLHVANEPGCHGKRYIVNDGSCSWRDFIGPLLPESAESYSSYSVEELKSLDKARRTRLRQVGKSLLGNNTLRNWFREQEWFGPFVESTRSYLRKHPSLNATHGSGAEAIQPPAWLADLFGPTITKFSSAKLEEIGWRSLVDLKTAQQRTVRWLEESGYR